MQIRCKASKSAANVAELLRVLKDGGVDLAAIGGGNLEWDGDVVVVPKEGQEDKAIAVLKNEHYRPHRIDVGKDDRLRLCWIADAVGTLYECVAEAATINLEKGRIIRDIVIGPQAGQDDPEHPGLWPVHVFSDDVLSKAVLERQRAD